MPGMPLGFPFGPADLLVEEDGSPARIDKAFSWEHPIAAHGMMHMVIRNAWAGDPYPIDTLFMFMANMSWNSSMNTDETMAMLTDKDEATGEYKIPRIIYSDAFYSEMVAYADLILPDTTYLERWDCVSMLDRPISSAHGPADAIRQPVVKPDRDVRPFQDVLIELGARLGLPAFTNKEGTAKFPGGYSDYLVNHERAPGIGSLAGWRGAQGTQSGRGDVNPNQLEAYIENGCFWRHELPPEHRYYRHSNGGYLRYAFDMGWITHTGQIALQLYCEPLAKFRQAARGHGTPQPPDIHRERIEAYFDPLPIWYPPFDDGTAGEPVDDDDYPLHAITQRPMAMYHSWGSQNAWLRQIHGQNRLFMNRRTAARLGLEDDDWVWIENGRGRVKGQLRCMEGCNDDTVWTWNAIGKRRGAWNLDEDAPEATKGFLLNHLISELLPPRNGTSYSNSDPITGQAAWFDLKVRVVKALPNEVGESAPQFEPIPVRNILAPPPSQLGRKETS
jgi:anaerobic selenocysteine-containing dehydrogenase